MSNIKTYAFIFARGGSKGLKNKNLFKIDGKPLIAHSIEAALKNKKINKVFVSSDSKAIKKVSRVYGAIVIDRPKYLALDKTPEWLAWQHAIKHLKNKNEDFDVFLSLPPTSPLRSQKDINNLLKAFTKNVDVIISVTPSSRNPAFNMVKIDKKGKTNLIEKNIQVSRRQDAPKYFDITTVGYVTRPDFILSKKNLFSGKVKSIIVPKERAIDIDDFTDASIAKFLYERSK
jgi:N-acylneuraminate cytidylyltransferase